MEDVTSYRGRRDVLSQKPVRLIDKNEILRPICLL